MKAGGRPPVRRITRFRSSTARHRSGHEQPGAASREYELAPAGGNQLPATACVRRPLRRSLVILCSAGFVLRSSPCLCKWAFLHARESVRFRRKQGCAARLRATRFFARPACRRAKSLAAIPFGCKHDAESDDFEPVHDVVAYSAQRRRRDLRRERCFRRRTRSWMRTARPAARAAAGSGELKRAAAIGARV